MRVGSSLGARNLADRTYGSLASSLGLVEELAARALELIKREDMWFRKEIRLMVLEELRPHL